MHYGKCGQTFVLIAFSLGCGANAPNGGSESTGSGGAGGSSGNAAFGGTSSAGTNSAGTNSAGSSAGGGDSSGGTSGAGSSAGGTGGTDPLPHVVTPCDALPEPGTWEEITPPGVALDDGEYGTNMFVMNPQDTSVVTLGTSKQGVWRTTDCGSSWTKMNTGTNGTSLDQGRQWSMVIDPVNPDTIYTVTGYGPNGVWKTTNGGVDWNEIVPQDVLSAFESGGFTHLVNIDPTDPLHLTVSPHFSCLGEHAPNCLIETTDGGATWAILDDSPPAGEGSGRAMLDYDTWLWSKGFDGLYRTSNRGESWTLVGGQEGYSRNSFRRAPDGTIYNPAAFDIKASTDDGMSWYKVENSPGTEVLTVSTKRIWASAGACVAKADEPRQPISYASVDDPTTWTELPGPNPGLDWGGDHLEYDADHGLLYISACRSGFWRVRVDE
jgi:hypothetical protein